MESVETRLQSLRSQQQESSRRYAQAEAQLDAVRARKAEALASLKEKGFDSPEAARKRVEELTGEVEDVLSDIESKVKGL